LEGAREVADTEEMGRALLLSKLKPPPAPLAVAGMAMMWRP